MPPLSIPAVHIHLEGYTAFFRTVWTVSGRQLTLPCPPYSTILGLISCCARRTITPADTRIGYEFSSISESEDLERTNRFSLKHGILSKHPEGQYLVRRTVHFRPELDLYLTNLALAEVFRNPIGVPTLGRSQDLCWIKKVEEISLTPVASGMIGTTMIANDKLTKLISPELVSCVEYFDNESLGMVRKVAAKRTFQIIANTNGKRRQITAGNLYHPSNLPIEDAIYIHDWIR